MGIESEPRAFCSQPVVSVVPYICLLPRITDLGADFYFYFFFSLRWSIWVHDDNRAINWLRV